MVDRSVVVRDFEPDDQSDVRGLILAGLGEHWGHVDETLNPDIDDIASSYRTGRIVVADLDSVLAGCGILVPRERQVAEIVRVSVDSAVRHRGVGRQVVAELLQTARDWQLDRVVLETTATWSGVIAFWLRCDFVLTHHEDGPFSRDAWFEYRL